jgi:hypothetical protein
VRNIAQIARREVEAHRRKLSGITAEKPRYKVVDPNGSKEWVVDVYLGEAKDADHKNIVRDCPIAPIAKNLVTDVRQPVELERSKQGKFTVVGRSKYVPAGTQTPQGSILEPNYHEIEVNLAQLGLLWIADLDYELEAWGERTWGEPGKPFQMIRAFDAFGVQVLGPEVDAEDVPPALHLEPKKTTATKHLVIKRKPWGHGPDAFKFGKDRWGAMSEKVLEVTE